MNKLSFEQEGFESTNELTLSFREQAITLGSCLLAGVGGGIFWGNVSKAAYSLVSSANFEMSANHNAIMAASGLIGGLLMNDMLHTADTFSVDYDQEDPIV